jgi:hypothetical protein
VVVSLNGLKHAVLETLTKVSVAIEHAVDVHFDCEPFYWLLNNRLGCAHSFGISKAHFVGRSLMFNQVTFLVDGTAGARSLRLI